MNGRASAKHRALRVAGLPRTLDKALQALFSEVDGVAHDSEAAPSLMEVVVIRAEAGGFSHTQSFDAFDYARNSA